MSDSLGNANFPGSFSTSAARHSFGKPKPITDPSLEKARKTILRRRNLILPRTKTSLARGSVRATSCTSATVTGIQEQYVVSRADVAQQPGSDPWCRDCHESVTKVCRTVARRSVGAQDGGGR